METRTITAADGPAASGGYCQAVEIKNATRMLYVSGQIPADTDGNVPECFEDQARLVWANIGKQLRAAEMTLENIVKVTTFLSGRDHREANSKVRQEVLGNIAPALTVIISGIFDEAWLLEIEVVAAA
jgi:2-iminobutanoate/2-iminopropanoate deaminase